ncbi:MAG: hypothetical protein ACYC1C_17460 [Chloroflexota bacterium]
MRTRAWSRLAGWLGISILLSGAVLFTGCPQVGGSLSEGPGSADIRTFTTTMRTAQVPNFGNYGFTQVLASQDVQPGSAATVTGGPYTVNIPAGAFNDPVLFEILQAPLSDVQPTAPPNEQPVLNFAFRVTDLNTGQLIGDFATPVILVARSGMIIPQSQYWDYTPSGRYILNPTGRPVQAGELRAPVPTASVAWVITNPTTATGTSTASSTVGTMTTTTTTTMTTTGSASSPAAGPTY